MPALLQASALLAGVALAVGLLAVTALVLGRLLTGALGLAGQHTEARAALAQFRAHCPQARAAPSAPLRALGGDWREMYEDALRAAGLPD